MEGQRGDSGSSLLEDLDLKLGGVDATQPGPGNADDVDELTKKGGVFLSLNSSGKQVGAVKPLLAAFLLLLMSGALLLVSSRWRSHRLGLRSERIRLSLDDNCMHKHLDDLSLAAKGMNDTWESSALPVREAFIKHFTPSLEDDQEPPEDPLAIIRDHIAKMQECKIPSDSCPKARIDFAHHLQLLRSICRAVTLRLQELEWLAKLNREFDVPVPVPGYEKPYSHSDGKDNNSMGFGMRAVDFLASLEMVGGERTQPVDGTLARGLIFLLSVENKHDVYNLVVRYYFQYFLRAFGDVDALHPTRPIAKYQIPYTGESFQTGALIKAAAHLFSESDNTSSYESVRKIHRIAENWTSTGVVRATENQRKGNADNFEKRLNMKREQMRALLKDGIPSDDLVIIALFLL